MSLKKTIAEFLHDFFFREEFIKRLLGQMLLEPRCEGSIVGGVSVLLTLLGNEKRGDQAWDKPSPGAVVVAENTITALIPYLADFVDIMHKPPTVIIFDSCHHQP